MIDAIREEARERGITRLCHFTPSRNLMHIASGEEGILATEQLREDDRKVYNPSDRERHDRHPDYVPCSIEYPNIWYFKNARRDGHVLFCDWVVLLIEPDFLWEEGTRFCPRNAAAEYGRLVREGGEAFRSLYADEVEGAYGQTYERTEDFLEPCPTDNQAEVLVPDRIGIDRIRGIAVSSEEQAGREYARIDTLSVPSDQFRFVVAPAFYDPNRLSTAISEGRRPEEREWTPSEASR